MPQPPQHEADEDPGDDLTGATALREDGSVVRLRRRRRDPEDLPSSAD